MGASVAGLALREVLPNSDLSSNICLSLRKPFDLTRDCLDTPHFDIMEETALLPDVPQGVVLESSVVVEGIALLPGALQGVVLEPSVVLKGLASLPCIPKQGIILEPSIVLKGLVFIGIPQCIILVPLIVEAIACSPGVLQEILLVPGSVHGMSLLSTLFLSHGIILVPSGVGDIFRQLLTAEVGFVAPLTVLIRGVAIMEARGSLSSDEIREVVRRGSLEYLDCKAKC